MGNPTGKIIREMHSTGHGSDYYGTCEQCGKHMSECFVSKVLVERVRSDGTIYFNGHSSAFGHRECLEKQFGPHVERSTASILKEVE